MSPGSPQSPRSLVESLNVAEESNVLKITGDEDCGYQTQYYFWDHLLSWPHNDPKQYNKNTHYLVKYLIKGIPPSDSPEWKCTFLGKSSGVDYTSWIKRSPPTSSSRYMLEATHNDLISFFLKSIPVWSILVGSVPQPSSSPEDTAPTIDLQESNRMTNVTSNGVKW